jgi:hypothetical protein
VNRGYVLFVAVNNSSQKQSLPEESLVVIFSSNGLPSNLLQAVLNQLQSELLQTCLDLLVVSEDRLDLADGVQCLVENAHMRLVLEALDKGQKCRSGAISGEGDLGG